MQTTGIRNIQKSIMAMGFDFIFLKVIIIYRN